MSIVPSGTKKDQIKQGHFKNESIFSSELFSKFAQGAGSLIDDPVNQNQNTMPSQDLQNTMNSGGLNHDGVSDRLEQQGLTQNMQPGSSPASRFLGRNSDEEEASQINPDMIYQQEEGNIRKFIGNDFGMRLKSNNDGTYSVTIKPPQGVPITDPVGFTNELVKMIGGARIETDTPDKTNPDGSVSVTYRPAGGSSQKIKPRNKMRR